MDFAADKINWKYRRRYLLGVTAFVMIMICLAVFGIPAESVSELIVTNGFWILAAMTGTYVFGAVWDQMSQRQLAVSSSRFENNYGLSGADGGYLPPQTFSDEVEEFRNAGVAG